MSDNKLTSLVITVKKQKKTSISKLSLDVAHCFLGVKQKMIHPHLLVRLPCYNFSPFHSPTFGIPLVAVKVTILGIANSYSVKGCVYNSYCLAIQTDDGFLELTHPHRITTLCSAHCLTQHLTAQANDNHAPPVSLFPRAPFSFKTIRYVSSPSEIFNAFATMLHWTSGSAFIVGILFYLYAFYRSTGNSLCPYCTLTCLGFDGGLEKPPIDALYPIILDNACILCLIMVAGIELTDVYSSDTVIAFRRKEVHGPWPFYLHTVLLRQFFTYCGKFPTGVSRMSLGRVSVPV
ncbi:hypothetical protein IHE45_17G067700 [Dioscorea alata]|uniref:Uncharacterized protein n=1 Tax=Dioscorea alata TaxID=55571 RepID=A0ACB7UCT9_DIOAL|nr:hypothetical protein IHE45_17G067700 [Dioscorea alata]